MSCVDVGCGAGFTTQIISQMIGKKGHIIGIDVDERYLQYCRNAKQQTNAKFMLDDIWNRTAGWSKKGITLISYIHGSCFFT
jgi:ubiquinone/menaquinone biosynthesis C-methylase UbiE